MSNQTITDTAKDSPTIAVIIPTFRRGPYLVNTLRGLAEQTTQPDEILILDQTPVEEYEITVRDFLESGSGTGDFHWIQLSEPAVSKARNRAILETQCDILLYLDDDIEPSKELVGFHLRHYQNCAIHAVIGSEFKPQQQRMVSPPGDFLDRSVVEQAFTYRTNFNVPLSGVGFMYANNFSVRRGIIIDIGGWDEHILNYGDRDLGIRLAKSGYRIDYDPEAYIIHYNSPGGGTRVTDSSNPWQGWQRCVSLFYLGFRHLRGLMFLKYGVYRAARFSFLLKQNAVRPWRWPGEVYGFFKAFFVAHQWANSGVKSSFVGNKLH